VTSLRAPSSDDRDLVARAAGGDDEAFAQLYDRHASALLAYARQYVGDAATAEDVVQQTFLAAYKTVRSGVELRHPRAWLYLVTRNNALSIIRSRPAGESEALLGEELQAHAATVSDQVEQREELQAVVKDLIALPPEQRAALALFEMGDLSQAEIAGALGVDAKKVKALVFQARVALVHQREARSATCQSVREKLTSTTGGALNHRLIRHHLQRCEPCTAFREELRDRRRRLAILLPFPATLALREAVLAALGDSAHAGAAAGAAAGAGASAGAGGVLSPGRRILRIRRTAAGTAMTAAVAGLVTIVLAGGGEPPLNRAARSGLGTAAAAAAPAASGATAPSSRATPARKTTKKNTTSRPAAPTGARRAAGGAIATPAPEAGRRDVRAERESGARSPARPPAREPSPATTAPTGGPGPAAAPGPSPGSTARPEPTFTPDAMPAPTATPPATRPDPTPDPPPRPAPVPTPVPTPVPAPVPKPDGECHGHNHGAGNAWGHCPDLLPRPGRARDD
jgi:RNA polymerase sigma factor (sigma-70 family)